MKKSIYLWLFMIIPGMIITSCQKTTQDNVTSREATIENTIHPLQTPESSQALYKAVMEYINNNAAERSYDPSTDFFTQTSLGDFGFGFLDDEGINFVVYSTIPDADDYFVENADGTVTVHMNSDNASVINTNMMEGNVYMGFMEHMVMNYSGPVIKVPYFDIFGNPAFLYLVVTGSPQSPASVWHGDGPVQSLLDGSEYDLISHLVATAHWKKVKKTVNLN